MKKYKLVEFTQGDKKWYVIYKRTFFFFWTDGSFPGALGETLGMMRYDDKETALREMQQLDSPIISVEVI